MAKVARKALGNKIKKIMHDGIRQNTHKPVSSSNPRHKVSDKQAVAVAFSMLGGNKRKK